MQVAILFRFVVIFGSVNASLICHPTRLSLALMARTSRKCVCSRVLARPSLPAEASGRDAKL